MGRKPSGGHVRTLGGHAQYRHIRVMVDGRSKQVLEHRHVMELHLVRKLLPTEIVHHRDHNGLNNAIENLEIMTFRDHQRHHMLAAGPQQYPIAEAIRLRSEGWSVLRIAKHFNVGDNNVRSAFRARSISTCDLRHGQLRWDVDRAMAMFNDGETVAKIARAVGVKPPSIRKAFLKRGLIAKRA